MLSVGDGEVVVAKRSGAAGYYIAIRHGRTYTTRYMHLRKLLVKPGQKVKRGDRIALSGNTGRSTGPHPAFLFCVRRRRRYTIHNSFSRQQTLEKHGNQKK